MRSIHSFALNSVTSAALLLLQRKERCKRSCTRARASKKKRARALEPPSVTQFLHHRAIKAAVVRKFTSCTASHQDQWSGFRWLARPFIEIHGRREALIKPRVDNSDLRAGRIRNENRTACARYKRWWQSCRFLVCGKAINGVRGLKLCISARHCVLLNRCGCAICGAYKSLFDCFPWTLADKRRR